MYIICKNIFIHSVINLQIYVCICTSNAIWLPFLVYFNNSCQPTWAAMSHSLGNDIKSAILRFHTQEILLYTLSADFFAQA